MNKYLFTDGTNGVKEAQSEEELLALINSAAEPCKARVWVFNTNEWIACSSFERQNPDFAKQEPAALVQNSENTLVQKSPAKQWFKNALFVTIVLAGALLVFNFTSAKWEKADALKTTATRPANVPLLDLDSLISEVELIRGKFLDKSTRYNLRLRNNWPEHIQLQLSAEKETKGKSSRFFNVGVSIDNATGFMLDNVKVKLLTWRNGKASAADTLQFTNIRYDKTLVRQLSNSFRGDSISVSFQSIRAKIFNFCYSDEMKSTSGNSIDRWFCREGKTNN